MPNQAKSDKDGVINPPKITISVDLNTQNIDVFHVVRLFQVKNFAIFEEKLISVYAAVFHFNPTDIDC